MGKESTGIDTRAVMAAGKFLGLPVAAKNTVPPADLECTKLITRCEETPAESEREQEIKERMEKLIRDLIRDCSDPEKLAEYWDTTTSHSIRQLIQESIGKLFAAVRPKKEVPEWAISMLLSAVRPRKEQGAFLHPLLKALAASILDAAGKEWVAGNPERRKKCLQ